jgi:uncharacterized protein
MRFGLFLTVGLMLFACAPSWAADSNDNISALERAAADGNAAAQTALGLRFQEGEGVSQDFEVARKWLAMAAATGVAEAQFGLGTLYFGGLGGERDIKQAVRWITAAADQGYGKAEGVLGILYARGEGVPQDAAAAVKWQHSGAEKGDGLSQLGLARSYQHGVGVARDLKQAYIWYALVAGNPDPTIDAELRESLVEEHDTIGAALSPQDREAADKFIGAWSAKRD